MPYKAKKENLKNVNCLFKIKLQKKISKTTILRFSNLHQITNPIIDLHLMKQQ